MIIDSWTVEEVEDAIKKGDINDKIIRLRKAGIITEDWKVNPKYKPEEKKN